MILCSAIVATECASPSGEQADHDKKNNHTAQPCCPATANPKRDTGCSRSTWRTAGIHRHRKFDASNFGNAKKRNVRRPPRPGVRRAKREGSGSAQAGVDPLERRWIGTEVGRVERVERGADDGRNADRDGVLVSASVLQVDDGIRRFSSLAGLVSRSDAGPEGCLIKITLGDGAPVIQFKER